jgi:hypothetical protein
MEDRLPDVIEKEDGTKVTGVKAMSEYRLKELNIYTYTTEHGLEFDPETQNVGKALTFDGEKVNVMYKVFDNNPPEEDGIPRHS